MIYDKIVSRPKGTIETFEQDGSVFAGNSGLTISGMVAAVTAGTAHSISSQTYASESLLFQVNFSEVGSSVMTITTSFAATDEKHVSVWRFRTLDDGSINGGYV